MAYDFEPVEYLEYQFVIIVSFIWRVCVATQMGSP